MIDFKLVDVPEGDALYWAANRTFRLPSGIASEIQKLAAAGSGDVRLEQIEAFSPDEADTLRLLCAYTPAPPISSRMPVSYQSVPPILRSFLAKLVGKWKRKSEEKWARFPRWPVDLSTDVLADLAGARSPFACGPTPVLLSHDLDSQEGVNNLLSKFLKIEESFNAASANYIVPCAWPIDHTQLQELQTRGHEIGIHGYDHSNLTPFASRDVQHFRLKAANDLISRYDIAGYRAPSLLRTRSLLECLRKFFRYDSSIPTSGGLFPVPNNGCASARPFMLNGLPEIPLSMPRDGSLIFLGYKPKEILRIWKESAEFIAESGGVVSLLTHCESRFSGNADMLDIYRDFLTYLHESDNFFFSSTSAVLDYSALVNDLFAEQRIND